MTALFPARGDVAILVPAAGSGVRMGPGLPKALRLLRGESLLVHAIRAIAAAPSTGMIVVAAPAADVPDVSAMLSAIAKSSGWGPDAESPLPATRVAPEIHVVAGGATRQASVAAALARVPDDFDLVLVHDAARCLAPAELVESVAAALRAGARAVIPVLPVVDTIKRVDDHEDVTETVDRTPLRAVQTPQGFDRKTLIEAHARAAAAHTDDAGAVEAMGVRVATVPGSDRAFKITRPFDLALAEAILTSDEILASEP